MIQINLLPWREQARKAKKARLAFLAGGCAVLAVLSVGLIHLQYRSEIKHQQQRNKEMLGYLEKENNELFDLKKKKVEVEIIDKQLEFIFALRHAGFKAVDILNELAKVSPETVTLDKIVREDDVITVFGKAKSNLQITLFMENIKQSKLFNQPVLTRISGKDGEVGRERSFQLRVQLEGK